MSNEQSPTIDYATPPSRRNRWILGAVIGITAGAAFTVVVMACLLFFFRARATPATAVPVASPAPTGGATR